MTLKDEKGQFQPDAIKYHTALYYQNPYHKEVAATTILYQSDKDHENLIYNLLPSEVEVSDAINDKTNGKSTTDIKNEMLKRPGDKMIKFIYPLVKTILGRRGYTKIMEYGTYYK